MWFTYISHFRSCSTRYMTHNKHYTTLCHHKLLFQYVIVMISVAQELPLRLLHLVWCCYVINVNMTYEPVSISYYKNSLNKSILV